MCKKCYLQRRVSSTNSPNELHDALGFGLRVVDVQAIRQEIEQQLQQQQNVNKRGLAAQLRKVSDVEDADDVLIDNVADADADVDAEDVATNSRHNFRLFRELSPAMRRFLLTRSN